MNLGDNLVNSSLVTSGELTTLKLYRTGFDLLATQSNREDGKRNKA